MLKERCHFLLPRVIILFNNVHVCYSMCKISHVHRLFPKAVLHAQILVYKKHNLWRPVSWETQQVQRMAELKQKLTQIHIEHISPNEAWKEVYTHYLQGNSKGNTWYDTHTQNAMPYYKVFQIAVRSGGGGFAKESAKGRFFQVGGIIKFLAVWGTPPPMIPL